MKPALLFYCQHSVGVGHLMRSFALARSLEQRFRVIFLNGGPIPLGLHVPAGVELIDLPPLGMEDGHNLSSRDGKIDVAAAKEIRRTKVMAAFNANRPSVVLIELFPFGRKKFAFELLPLLRHTRRGDAVVISSVRDILVNARPDQQRHDDRAAWLCKRYFDAVLVHADPRLARFEESFSPRKPLAVALQYTGFVSAVRQSEAVPQGKAAGEREKVVLVSAGGGLVGLPLLNAALQAQSVLPEVGRWPMKLVAGPFLPEAEWEQLQQLAQGRADVTLVRSVPDLAKEMRRAGMSISQCGYNTAMDLIASRVPALVVPYAAQREDEQQNRAARLQQLGALRVLPPSELTARSLAREIALTQRFEPSANSLDLNGTERSAEIVEQLMHAHADHQRTEVAHAI
jgi:predicted glycosyltransferase